MFSGRMLTRAVGRLLLLRPNGKVLCSTASTSAVRQEEPRLFISEDCVKRLKKIAGANEFLRVSVDGGGCSGFEYKFDLDTKVDSEDLVFERDGVAVVVDKMSLDYLKGSTVDYKEELIKAAFKVVNNPKAEKGCSCGVSFSLKPDAIS